MLISFYNKLPTSLKPLFDCSDNGASPPIVRVYPLVPQIKALWVYGYYLE